MSIKSGPPDALCTDDIHRGSIVALRQWCNEGRYRTDWRDYRESAIAWLKESIARLGARRVGETMGDLRNGCTYVC